MKRLTTFFSILLLFSLTLPLLAEQGTLSRYQPTPQPLTSQKIQKMDHSHTRHRALRRDFKNLREFQRLQRYHRLHKQQSSYLIHQAYYGFKPHYPAKNRQKGYRYSKRGWELAYRYDRADFFDRYGYHYGYFNRQGYYFEGIFYRYDRFYGYHDRVRGRELFGRHFYMPANYRYYGFDPHPYR